MRLLRARDRGPATARLAAAAAGLLGLLAACAPGGAPGDGTGGAPATLSVAEYVELVARTECDRLAAGEEPGALELRRETALRALGRDRHALLAPPPGAGPEVRDRVEARIAECRARAGWIRRDGPAGEVLWRRLGP